MKKLLGLMALTLLLISQIACSGIPDSGVPEAGVTTVYLTLTGGSGRATVDHESTMTTVDGHSTVTVTWSSPNYDYMLVEGEKYLPVNTEGNSVFEIPVPVLEEPFTVIGDTVAMSTPHEVEYELTVSLSDSESGGEMSPAENEEGDNTNSNEAEIWLAGHLEGENQVALQYASGFTIRTYDSGARVYVINGEYYLQAPEEPDNLPEAITYIKEQTDRIYVVGTGSMDYFVSAQALDTVAYSSLQEQDWQLEAVQQAM